MLLKGTWKKRVIAISAVSTLLGGSVPVSAAQLAPNRLPYAHEIQSLTSEDYSDLSF